MENNKITSHLFCEDIRNENLKKIFENIFKFKITDLLSDYDYDEIDEFPFEIEKKGIMIGFIAETIKVQPQIEYIDLDTYNYPKNINYLIKRIPYKFDSLNIENISNCLTECSYLRIYYSLYNINQVNRIIFQYEDLRYELLINENLVVVRIRVYFYKIESSIDMRTYYPFSNE
ncbi:hypothetical protein [Apibacter adventoris]|uniref:hypothetical protein n=1 Tax=Apibacter adventoris TaxID=1679466 RepID=UPI000CF6C61C|nr:hypothetical protein [Apibacter adventoris]PQL93821.1 hypothetical protein C4S76_06965 [Apibacter adventoris]